MKCDVIEIKYQILSLFRWKKNETSYESSQMT